MRKTLLSTLAAAVLLGTAGLCPAQTGTKPVAVVSFAGYDTLFKNVEFLGKLSDNPGLSAGLEAMLKMMTNNQGLAGLDTKRPWGAVVETDGQQFPIYGFIPVTDLKQLLGILPPALGQSKDTGNGVYEIQTQARPLYVKQKGSWAFVCDSPETLAKTPDDPTKLLGDLNKQYDLAVSLLVSNVPPPLRQLIMAPIEQGLQMGMQQMPGEDDEAFALRKKLSQQGLQRMTTLLKELETVTAGWRIDPSARTSYLEILMTVQEGSEFARDLASVGEAKTNFAGFQLPGAALTGNWARTVNAADVEQLVSVIDSLRARVLKEIENQSLPEEQLKVAKQALGDALDVVQATAKSGRSDGGLALMLDPKAVTLVAGAYLAGGDKLEKALRQLLDMARKEDPELAKLVKLDAETHKGVRLHTAAIPLPADFEQREKLVQMLGETVEVVVGISDQSVYLSAGRDAMKALKQVIDKSASEGPKPTPPMQLSLALGAVAKFVAGVGDEDVQPMAAVLAAGLAQSAGKDHINLVGTPIQRGSKIRLEIEEGILKMLGSMAPRLGPGGPGDPAQTVPGAPGTGRGKRSGGGS